MKYALSGIIVILLVIIVGITAFYFGTRSSSSNQPTPTPTLSQEENSNAAPTTKEASEEKTTKSVSAGGVLSFPKYSLDIPLDWNSQREQGENSDLLTLTKGNYKIIISEGAFGGSGCLFPGDAPSEMAQTFSKFVEIINPNGFIFRRGSTSDSDTGWTLCEKSTNASSFGAPTQFGHISITTPVNPSAAVMSEIDSIFASIKKI